jgi:hypothetical protein
MVPMISPKIQADLCFNSDPIADNIMAIWKNITDSPKFPP